MKTWRGGKGPVPICEQQDIAAERNCARTRTRTRFSRLREPRCIRARHNPTKARYRNTHRLAPIPLRRSLGQGHPEALRARPADASVQEAPPPAASDRTVGRGPARNLEELRGARLTRWRHPSPVHNRRRTPKPHSHSRSSGLERPYARGAEARCGTRVNHTLACPRVPPNSDFASAQP